MVESKTLVDYKFFCFNGVPRFLYVSEGLNDHMTARMSFYDLEFNELPFGRFDYKRINHKINRPEQFEEMLEIAKKTFARSFIFAC